MLQRYVKKNHGTFPLSETWGDVVLATFPCCQHVRCMTNKLALFASAVMDERLQVACRHAIVYMGTENKQTPVTNSFSLPASPAPMKDNAHQLHVDCKALALLRHPAACRRASTATHTRSGMVAVDNRHRQRRSQEQDSMPSARSCQHFDICIILPLNT
jgi:hypothetical protein